MRRNKCKVHTQGEGLRCNYGKPGVRRPTKSQTLVPSPPTITLCKLLNRKRPKQLPRVAHPPPGPPRASLTPSRHDCQIGSSAGHNYTTSPSPGTRSRSLRSSRGRGACAYRVGGSCCEGDCAPARSLSSRATSAVGGVDCVRALDGAVTCDCCARDWVPDLIVMAAEAAVYVESAMFIG